MWDRDDLRGAPAVVLVSGLGMSSRYIILTADLLAKEVRVFAPELPGFGLSEKPRQPLNVQQLSRSLNLWMSEVGLNRAVFVGNSFGCQVISQLALTSPD
ncbi:MAG: alpha/beta hydrolase [Pyrinomonadaceae bacterium]